MRQTNPDLYMIKAVADLDFRGMLIETYIWLRKVTQLMCDAHSACGACSIYWDSGACPHRNVWPTEIEFGRNYDITLFI